MPDHNPILDALADYDPITTADILARTPQQNSFTALIRALASKIPENTENRLSMLNMARGGLNSAANWLDWNPEIGPDTLAPLGMAAAGTPLGMMRRHAKPNTTEMLDTSIPFPPQTPRNYPLHYDWEAQNPTLAAAYVAKDRAAHELSEIARSAWKNGASGMDWPTAQKYARATRPDLVKAYIDASHAITPAWARISPIIKGEFEDVTGQKRLSPPAP